MKKEDYQAYLQSEAWRIRRKWKLERAGFRCQVCNSDGELHVHHRTYERIGDEREDDLTVLCADCHAIFHKKVPPPEAASTARDGWDVIQRMWMAGLLPIEPGELVDGTRVARRGDRYFVVAPPGTVWHARKDRYDIARKVAQALACEVMAPREIVLVESEDEVPPHKEPT